MNREGNVVPQKRYDHAWNTDAELDFLGKLGTWAQGNMHRVSSRKKLLENYKKSTKGRRWDDNIDVKKIEDYLKDEIGLHRI